MADHEVNTGRRRFLTTTTAVVGAIGAGFAAVPFIGSFKPSARAQTAGAPAFPTVFSSGSGAQPNLAWTVDPAFQISRSWQTNVQFERALGDSYAAGIGFSYVKFWDLPVVTNVNLINPTSTLGDGRPVYWRWSRSSAAR